jgi:hypothetical protein
MIILLGESQVFLCDFFTRSFEIVRILNEMVAFLMCALFIDSYAD